MKIKTQNYSYHMNITNKYCECKEGYHQAVRKERKNGQEFIEAITYFFKYKKS